MIERYNPAFLDLIPDAYKGYVTEKLNVVAEPMSETEVKSLLSLNLFAE